jgi:hypothetical protein
MATTKGTIMKTRTLMFALFAIIAASAPSSAVAQDTKPSAELNVLSPLIGTWLTRAIHRPSVADKDGYTSEGEANGEWILDGQFLRFAGSTTSDTGRMNYESLITYDKRKRTYRRWFFRSDGLAAESTGNWDAKNNTLEWISVGLPANTKVTVQTVFKDQGFTSIVMGKRADGTVLTDQSWTVIPKNK